MTRGTRLTAALLSLPLVTAAGLSTATAVPAAADPAGSARRPAAIAWAPCPEDKAVECGTLAVPIDWARPGGPTIDLALARRKATGPGVRTGSLLIDPGGPGGSGVDALLGSWVSFSPEIMKHFDVVGFDPRGVGRSHPVICSTQLLAESPSPVLAGQAEFERLGAYNRSLMADCRKRTGPLFDHVDTLSVVRDMDAIRAAVGDEKLTYYGISYGTLMGQQYAEVFGDRVRALVLDSNMDHSLGTADFLRTETVTAQDSFDEFVAWCERTTTCPLRERGVRAVFADLKARADQGGLPVPGIPDLRLTSFDLRRIALGSFYGPSWAEFAADLVMLDSGTVPDQAQATALRARVGAGAQPGVRTSALPAATDPDPQVEEYSTPIFCEDWRLPVRDYQEYARYTQELSRLAPDMGPSPLALGMTMACVGWQGRVNNPQHKLHVRSGPTLLMLNALHDPATGYAWATNAARQLGDRAVLVTYEGWGHGVYGRSACTTTVVDSYLSALTVPDRGARCPAVSPDAGVSSLAPPAAGQARTVTGPVSGLWAVAQR